MEYVTKEEKNIPMEITEINDSESTEKFQKFIQELFEKNGVLNDLRAYLRGHIVDVLRSAETGSPTSCRKHFTQRLELQNQAMNVLIAEYLLQYEFSYTISVFTSEIPLSNMVFEFTKSLLKSTDLPISQLKFEDNDVWRILNYLGIQCDSEHANKIVHSYRDQGDIPLLLCILKCIPMYTKKPPIIENEHTSEDSLASSKSDGNLEYTRRNCQKGSIYKCKHYAVCKSCQDRIGNLKEKYKKKKNQLEEKLKTSNRNVLDVETLMQNIDIMEQSIIDEMFQQLKSVYESEVRMVREEKERKIRSAVANHAVQLQRQREQLEESLSARKSQFEHNVNQKKQFLWKLARELRSQRDKLAQAQDKLVEDKDKLVNEEKNLKIQLRNAEETIKKRGEEMKKQITEELSLLQKNLEDIKQERNSLNKEKIDFESKRNEENHIKPHYELLKNEIVLLKKYIEEKNKCLVEKGTVTDVYLMNNENAGSWRSDMKVKQVKNDLKKRKNINFNQPNPEGHTSGPHHTRTNDSETQTFQHDMIQHLKDENERLKAFSKQQSDHIERLSREKMLQTNLHAIRLNRAPSTCTHIPRVQFCAGEHAMYSMHARVLFPGEAVPFIGTVGDKRSSDHRRMLSQWRLSAPSCLHRPPSPNKNIQVKTSAILKKDEQIVPPQTNLPAVDLISDIKKENETKDSDVTIEEASCLVNNNIRQKSPKSVLREAKEKLKTNTPKDKPIIHRAKSPSATLREAKLRLRKLEIEAEAVEKSYLDFRKKQAGFKENKDIDNCKNPKQNIEIQDNHQIKSKESSINILDKTYKSDNKVDYTISNDLIEKDFDKYFRRYQKISENELNVKNAKSVIDKVKSFKDFSKIEQESSYLKTDYLETPLLEFRKLYQTEKSRRVTPRASKTLIENESKIIDKDNISSDIIADIIKETDKENSEVDIIKSDSKVFNVNKSPGLELDSNAKCDAVQIVKQQENVGDCKNDSKPMEKDSTEIITKPSEVLIQPETHTDDSKVIKDDDIMQEIGVLEENINKPDAINSNSNIDKGIDTDTTIITLESKANPLINEQDKPNSIISNPNINIETGIDRDKIENVLNEQNNENSNTKNLLLVEVENIHEISNIITESNQNLSVVVETSIGDSELVLNEDNNEISTYMTILVSPKDKNRNENIVSEIAKLTENDTLNAIYRAKGDMSSPVLESNNEKSENDTTYNDDFLADVDNYNSKSEYENSPISLPKNSEDDNFWDS